MLNSQLFKLLNNRIELNKPLRVGLIGAGKFGTMFFNQIRTFKGLHLLGVADISIRRTWDALELAGWSKEQLSAKTFKDAIKTGKTFLVDNGEELINASGLEIIIEATGLPSIGIEHALKAFKKNVHVIMVNVEADALAGPLLAKRAGDSGCVYSLAYGDQPALIYEMVDWANICGFNVVCAGKGTKYLPVYRKSTPETVWEYYGFSTETVKKGDFNPKMFNSFIDGTKSAIEMAAVSNATGLIPQANGLKFPPAGAKDLVKVCIPKKDGGQLMHKGTVEVVSCLKRNGQKVNNDLRWGVFVVIEAQNEYAKRCFAEYGMISDESGYYTSMYRPYHLIGMELVVSVLRVGLRGEPTGTPIGFIGDVAATAKCNLKKGDILDGEGGYYVYGSLIPAKQSITDNLLPLGLANKLKLKNKVIKNHYINWSDVEYDENDLAISFRREMELKIVS